MKKTLVGVWLALVALPAPAAECVDGASNGFACSHVEFVGHLSPADMNGAGEVLNDIWGWIDPLNGEEYAIVGMQDGTAFVRIRDTGALEFLGRLPASDGRSAIPKRTNVKSGGHAHKQCHDDLCGAEDSAWRDIKVYDHYAYIVSEAEGHGVQVFDLTKLRPLTGNPPQDFGGADGFYNGIGHAHNIFINEDTARAYVVGHNSAIVSGGLHVLDLLSNPTNPQFIGEVNADGYTHDVQCVVYAGPDPDIAPGSEICFASNEDTLTVWDVTGAKAANAEMLSRTPYSQSGYTHQGWLSDDQRYFFLNDELDERNTGSRTHLRVFDVSDVSAPELAADYFAPTLAIDHNNYVHGRWLLQSNYGAGLRILDVLDPEHPVQAAYFDPQPTDETDFYGTWSNFLFPTSGLVAFSDINGGLFVVRPTLSDVTAPDLAVSLALSAGEAETGVAVDADVAVSNGDAVAASDVLLTVHLPAGAEFIAIDEPDGWDCGAPARVVECRIASLAAGATADFALSLSAASGGAVEAIAMVYAREADAAPADNLDGASLTVTAPPAPSSPPSGGGGGGGAGLWLLPLLCLLQAPGLRWRHRRR